MRKLKQREVRSLVQGHTESHWTGGGGSQTQAGRLQGQMSSSVPSEDSGTTVENTWQSGCPSSSGKKQWGSDYVSGRKKEGEKIKSGERYREGRLHIRIASWGIDLQCFTNWALNAFWCWMYSLFSCITPRLLLYFPLQPDFWKLIHLWPLIP